MEIDLKKQCAEGKMKSQSINFMKSDRLDDHFCMIVLVQLRG